MIEECNCVHAIRDKQVYITEYTADVKAIFYQDQQNYTVESGMHEISKRLHYINIPSCAVWCIIYEEPVNRSLRYSLNWC